MPPPSKAAIGTRIASYQLTISPLRTPPPRSPMPDPLSNLSLSSSGDISEPTYLDSTEYSKNYQPPPRKNTLPSTAHRSLPQRIHQSYLHSKSPPSSTTTPSSSKFSFSRIMQGKLRQTRVCLSINYKVLTLRFPRPAQPPCRDKIDKTGGDILSSVFRYEHSSYHCYNVR